MKTLDVAQNSLEWLMARAGVVTASEFDNIVTPTFATRTGDMPASYLAVKLAEKWLGGPMPGFNMIDMEFGKILEEEALPFFTLETGVEIQRVGLLTSDDGRIGCSPDGLIGEDSGIECKCPQAKTHVRYLLGGVVPTEYLPQVHGAMYVTGRARWVFMSYCRRFPPLILTVERDEEIQEKLDGALKKFLDKVYISWERLCFLNGGPPLRPVPPTRREFVSDSNDLMP